MEVIGIKKLFDYKLFMGKSLYPVNWATLIYTTVDTLMYKAYRAKINPKIIVFYINFIEKLHDLFDQPKIVTSQGPNISAYFIRAFLCNFGFRI